QTGTPTPAAASPSPRGRRAERCRTVRATRRSRSPTRRADRVGAGRRESRVRSSPGATIHAEGPEGEVLRVEVVLEIEDARKAGAVPERVFPRAVGRLRGRQLADAHLDRTARRL